MAVKVYAKLNLTLNVLGKREGYHNIDSVAVSADVFDVVQVVPRLDKRVTVSGCPNIPLRQNSAYKATRAFMEHFPVLMGSKIFDRHFPFGADIEITKGIPQGAGMGGSSADAAAVIYDLCQLYHVDVNSREVRKLCEKLGSDVSFMLLGGLGRLRGKGNAVEFFKLASPIYFALTTFDTSMSTAEVYSRFDDIGKSDLTFADNAALLNALQSGALDNAFQYFNNHLQSAAASISDYANSYLRFCFSRGLSPNMTGSGSAYYVAFTDERQAAQAVDTLNADGFKTMLCRTVPCGMEDV